MYCLGFTVSKGWSKKKTTGKHLDPSYLESWDFKNICFFNFLLQYFSYQIKFLQVIGFSGFKLFITAIQFESSNEITVISMVVAKMKKIFWSSGYVMNK